MLTTANLPRLARGEHYVAWARSAGRWTRLGFIDAGQEDRALLVSDDEQLEKSIDAVRVTREAGRAQEPRGALVISWSE